MSESMDKTRQEPGGPLDTGRPLDGRWVAASVALHLSVLGLLLYTRPPQLAPVAMPGDRTGHLLSLTYSPGNSAPSSALQAPTRPAVKVVPTKSIAAPNPAPAAPSAPAASTSTEAATGADALGDGDTTLALVVSHPPPHPDLAQLPAGTRGDVIVDVVIDKTGRIAKFTMTHGLGHGVDETVLATIQQWTFQPATRNGIPVASEQELLFHYERG
jgi:protein TonB